MDAANRVWRNVIWSGLLVLGLATWVVGCLAVGLLTSHSGLATARDWIENPALFGAGAGFTFLSAAMLVRGLGDGREAARTAAFLWGALTVVGVLLAAPALLGAASVATREVAFLVGLAGLMPVVPLVSFLGAISRRRRARGGPGPAPDR